MDYGKDILNRLIDMYERRGAFDKDASSLRAIQIEVKKAYPEYMDRYNHEAYKDINVAVEKLCTEKFVFAEKNSVGQYSKVRLNIASVSECYRKLKRTSIPEQCEKVKKSFEEYQNSESQIVQAVIKHWYQHCFSQQKQILLRKVYLLQH